MERTKQLGCGKMYDVMAEVDIGEGKVKCRRKCNEDYLCPSCKSKENVKVVIKDNERLGMSSMGLNITKHLELKSNICKCGHQDFWHSNRKDRGGVLETHCTAGVCNCPKFEPQELTNSQSSDSNEIEGKRNVDYNSLGQVFSSSGGVSRPTDDTSNSPTASKEIIDNHKSNSCYSDKDNCLDEIKKELKDNFIPLSKHNEEVEKLKRLLSLKFPEQMSAVIDLMNMSNQIDNYKQLLSRINSIQEKAEAKLKDKDFQQNKIVYNTIIKTCKEIKAEEERK